MKELFPKRNALLSLAASISLCFTLFFFSPVDLFISNQKEFTVGASHIILPMLLLSIGASLVLFSLLLLIGAASKKLFDGAVCLVFGTLLAVYCQILLFNGKMQLIDGGENDYSEVSVFNHFNTRYTSREEALEKRQAQIHQYEKFYVRVCPDSRNADIRDRKPSADTRDKESERFKTVRILIIRTRPFDVKGEQHNRYPARPSRHRMDEQYA